MEKILVYNRFVGKMKVC